ncbi:MAG: P1 family peptidase [Rubellimicrobium sp.]|nr:P1 family peptidase [Rubellimicrobium sp.]
MRTGPRNLITDVAGLLVGQAEDHRIRTGVTVLTAACPFVAAVHVMGGAPGTRETDALAPGRAVEKVDALVLSGGSAFGLDACSGVMAALASAGRGFAVGPVRVPIVPGAILFDLLNGGDKSGPPPHAALGHAACLAAAEDFALGTAGAGTGATTATLKGGIGSASLVLPSGHVVGALVAVNAVGSVLAGHGPHFHAAPYEIGDEFGGLGPARSALPLAVPATKLRQGEATTIGIVATDADLTRGECLRLAVAGHDGIARAVVPAHTAMDGDLVFGAATGAVPVPADPLVHLMLGHAAALCMARAIARAVWHASPAPGDPLPTWRESLAGRPAAH